MIKRAIEDRCIAVSNEIVRLELDLEEVRKGVLQSLSAHKKDKKIGYRYPILEQDYQYIFVNKKDVLIAKKEELKNLKSLLVLLEEIVNE